MKRLVHALTLLLAPPILLLAQDAPITTGDIVKLLEAKISEEIILEKISISGCACDSSASAIINLRSAGASDGLIRSVINPLRPAGQPARLLRSAGAASPEPCSPPARAFPEALRSPLVLDLSFPKTKYVIQSNWQIKVDLLLTDISIVVKERNEPFIFATIPFDSFDSLVYERSSHARVKSAIFASPLWLLSKGKKHWLTLRYRNCGQPDFVVLRLDKNEYKSILAATEARTGMSVELVIDN